MTKRYLLQLEIGEQLEKEIEEMAMGPFVSKSEAARELLRRGLRDYRREIGRPKADDESETDAA